MAAFGSLRGISAKRAGLKSPGIKRRRCASESAVRSRASASAVGASRGVGVPNRHIAVSGRPPSIAASSRLQPPHTSRNTLSQA